MYVFSTDSGLKPDFVLLHVDNKCFNFISTELHGYIIDKLTNNIFLFRHIPISYKMPRISMSYLDSEKCILCMRALSIWIKHTSADILLELQRLRRKNI